MKDCAFGILEEVLADDTTRTMIPADLLVRAYKVLKADEEWRKKMSEKELAFVLAALRFAQDHREDFLAEFGDRHFDDMDPLQDEEIDILCEELNLGAVD